MTRARGAWLRVTSSLRAKVTISAVALLFVAMSLGVAVPSWVVAQSRRAAAEEALATAARDLNESVSQWLRRTTSVVSLLSELPDIASMSPDRQVPVLKATARVCPEVFLVMTTDLRGVNISRNDSVAPKSYGDRGYISRALGGSALAYETIISRTTSNPAVAFGVPIRGTQGQIVGALGLVTEITSLTKMVGATRIGQTGLAYLVDEKGQVIAHPESRFARSLADYSSEAPVRFARTHGQGLIAFETDVDLRSGSKVGTKRYLAHAIRLANGWSVVALQEEREAYAEVARFVRLALIALGAALIAVGALLWRFIGVALGPIAQLTRAAHQLAAGDLGKRVQVESRDELGILAQSFNAMAGAVEGHVLRLAEHQARLQETVAERTHELARRNGQMTRVFTNVDQGLLTVDRAGVVEDERSAAVALLLPEVATGVSLAQSLGSADPRFASVFVLAWQDLIDDSLSLELSVDQLPRRLLAHGRTIDVTYRLLFSRQDLTDATASGYDVVGALLVLTDVSSKVAAAEVELEQRAFLSVVERLIEDRQGVMEFLREASGLVSRVTQGNSESLRRDIHTLKGNAACYALATVSRLCDDLETSLAESGANELSATDAARLASTWGAFEQRIQRIIGAEGHRDLVIDEDEYQQLQTLLLGGAPRAELVKLVSLWRLHPIARRFGRLSDQAAALATRLGRSLDVRIVDNGVRVPDQEWSAFWLSLVHVVRNAIAHGIESPSERAQHGKPERGILELRAEFIGGELCVAVADDGRGIDWERVAVKARAAGLPAQTTADLTAAIFHEGLSTRDASDDVSGRGVGMSAVREAWEALGGVIVVRSPLSPHGGTEFTFRIPAALSAFAALPLAAQPLDS